MNEALIQKIKEKNPAIDLVVETDHVNIKNLWNDSTFMCRLEKNVDLSEFADISFPNELSLLYHKSKNQLEVIFSPLNTDDPIIRRKFNFHYQGNEYRTYFAEPTNFFQTIATGFRELEDSSETNYRNLKRFRDFYKRGSLANYIQKYFENKVPRNFFIEGQFAENFDFVSLAKHINFYMHHYDRETPILVIFEQEQDKKEYKTPCHTNNNDFPEIISFKTFDPVLIDLFQVSRRTVNTRLKFLFYFQVLEYCAYYYLNEDLKKRLTNIIKRPDILNNSNNYSKLLIEEFKDYFKQNDDSIKLEKIISEYCTWDDIKHEIEINKEYFSNDLIFDGEFRIPALITTTETFETEPKGILKQIKTNVEKIRNVLVHLRESRENKVILPTPRNNNLLIPYLHIIQRLSEQVALQHE